MVSTTNRLTPLQLVSTLSVYNKTMRKLQILIAVVTIIIVSTKYYKNDTKSKITRSSEMNVAPDINNHLRSIDIFRSMVI